MTRLIVNCIDRQGYSQCEVYPTDNTDFRSMFNEGIREAKHLCGGIDNIFSAVITDIEGIVLCSLR